MRSLSVDLAILNCILNIYLFNLTFILHKNYKKYVKFGILNYTIQRHIRKLYFLRCVLMYVHGIYVYDCFSFVDLWSIFLLVHFPFDESEVSPF